ncbi:MAG: hypothetical protein ACQEQ4_00490 [Fibrobacterota bacterium]
MNALIFSVSMFFFLFISCGPSADYSTPAAAYETYAAYLERENYRGVYESLSQEEQSAVSQNLEETVSGVAALLSSGDEPDPQAQEFIDMVQGKKNVRALAEKEGRDLYAAFMRTIDDETRSSMIVSGSVTDEKIREEKAQVIVNKRFMVTLVREGDTWKISDTPQSLTSLVAQAEMMLNAMGNTQVTFFDQHGTYGSLEDLFDTSMVEMLNTAEFFEYEVAPDDSEFTARATWIGAGRLQGESLIISGDDTPALTRGFGEDSDNLAALVPDWTE